MVTRPQYGRGVNGPGTLDWQPATADLVAAPVAAALAAWGRSDILTAPIDGDLADTAEFCEHYGVPLEDSANCVVIAGRRGEATRYAACVVLATTRADVNGVVRRRIDARRASFAPMDDAVALTGMEYGGITPVGLPEDWPVLVAPEVAAAEAVVVGSGIRGSKLAVPGALVAALPGAEVLADMARGAT